LVLVISRHLGRQLAVARGLVGGDVASEGVHTRGRACHLMLTPLLFSPLIDVGDVVVHCHVVDATAVVVSSLPPHRGRVVAFTNLMAG
jgi:hypothetical protein